MEKHDNPPYWFPAKRYGYGWGLPHTWQGWIVFFALSGLEYWLCSAAPRGRFPGLICSPGIRPDRFVYLDCLEKGRTSGLALGAPK